MYQDKDIGVVQYPLLITKKMKLLKVPKEILPVTLPENINLNVKGNPLEHQKEWKKINN